MSDAVDSKLSLEHASKRLEEVQAVIEVVDLWLERTRGRDVNYMKIPDISVSDWVTTELARYYQEERGWGYASFHSFEGVLTLSLHGSRQARVRNKRVVNRWSSDVVLLWLSLIGACALAVWKYVL